MPWKRAGKLNKTARWWDVSRRRQKRCRKCDREIRAGVYCYYCGRNKGLW